MYLSYKYIYLLFSAVRHPPFAVPPYTESCKMVLSATQHCLYWSKLLTVLLKKVQI